MKMKSKRILVFITLLLTLVLPNGCSHKPAVIETSTIEKISEIVAPLNIGFDVDDTILFSTPAFEQGFKSGEKPFSEKFWEIVNGSDRQHSVVKKKTEQIINEHKKKGDTVYVITARESYNGEELKKFLSDRLGIKKENIFFASKGKSELMRQLDIKLFYGDSDSDISDAQAAGAKGIRIQRSDKSSYKNKYNPGSLGEEIVPDSAE